MALLATVPGFASAEPLTDLVGEFDREFAQQIDAAGVPGGAYAVVHRDRIVRAAGHGVRRVGDRTAMVDADTVFRLASVSKTFAAPLTALLVAEGKLDWNAPVGRYLPQFKLKDGQADRLQLRHLLGQSTGIVPNAYDNLLDANQPLDRILPQFRSLAPICAPGECFTYQNIVFGLIDPVLEQASGQRYEVLLRQRLFEPLQMSHASVGLQAFEASGNRALPHVRRNGRWFATRVQPGYYQVAPAAGVNASATDLGRWLIAQLGHRPDVLPAALIDEVVRERVRTRRELRRKHWRDFVSDAHYGLGWRIYRIGDRPLYLHSGWVEGYVAEIAYSREQQLGLVVLLNAESGVFGEITSRFWRRALAQPAASMAARP